MSQVAFGVVPFAVPSCSKDIYFQDIALPTIICLD